MLFLCSLGISPALLFKTRLSKETGLQTLLLFFFYDLLIFFFIYLPHHTLALFELHAPVAVAAIRAVAHINGTMCRTFLEILISLCLLTSASVLSVHVSSLSFTSAQNHFPCHLTGI